MKIFFYLTTLLLFINTITVAKPLTASELQQLEIEAKSSLPSELSNSALYLIEGYKVKSGNCSGYYKLFFRFTDLPSTSGYITFSPEGSDCEYKITSELDLDIQGLGFSFFKLSHLNLSPLEATDIITKEDPKFSATGDFKIAQPLQPDIENPLYYISNANGPVGIVDATTGRVLLN